MNKRRPVLSALLSITLVIGLCPGFALAAPQDDPDTSLQAQSDVTLPASGMWGTCPWEISADGVLTVHPGVGAERVNYAFPWDEYRTSIKKAVFVEDNGNKVIAPKDCSFMFAAPVGWEVDSLVEIDLSGLDTSKTTDMSFMFSGCSSIKNLDLSHFDTSNVTSMAYMFGSHEEGYQPLAKLTSLDLSGFNTSNVTDMSGMFKNMRNATSINVSGFDTSKVDYMATMFFGCSSLTSLDLSGFDTSKVVNMSFMFEDCSSLASLDLNSLDTSNVTDMREMFLGCSSLASLDLNSFDTSNVTEMREMFSGCSSLASLDLSSFDTSYVKDIAFMFRDCSSLTILDLSAFNTQNVKNINDNPFIQYDHTKRGMWGMFKGCSSLIELDISSFDTSQAGDFAENMFEDCTSLAKLSVGKKTVNIELPAYKVNGHTDWYSQGSRSWFTSAQIKGSRQGTADTYTKSEAVPVITSGNDQVWKADSASGATFRSTASLADFVCLIVDNVVVDKSNYSLSEGSTVATLKPSFLNSLAAGEHEIQIASTTGVAKARFTTQKTTGNNGSSGNNPGSTGTAVKTVTMYRLYNPNTGEHLFTSDTNERDTLVPMGWKYEGEAWKAPSSGNAVYRLYNPNTGEHHYTLDANEYKVLQPMGWNGEGVFFYSDANKGLPVYRLFNSHADSFTHHYTTDQNEYKVLKTRGWTDEAIGWYGVK